MRWRMPLPAGVHICASTASNVQRKDGMRKPRSMIANCYSVVPGPRMEAYLGLQPPRADSTKPEAIATFKNGLIDLGDKEFVQAQTKHQKHCRQEARNVVRTPDAVYQERLPRVLSIRALQGGLSMQ